MTLCDEKCLYCPSKCGEEKGHEHKHRCTANLHRWRTVKGEVFILGRGEL